MITAPAFWNMPAGYLLNMHNTSSAFQMFASRVSCQLRLCCRSESIELQVKDNKHYVEWMMNFWCTRCIKLIVSPGFHCCWLNRETKSYRVVHIARQPETTVSPSSAPADASICPGIKECGLSAGERQDVHYLHAIIKPLNKHMLMIGFALFQNAKARNLTLNER